MMVAPRGQTPGLTVVETDATRPVAVIDAPVSDEKLHVGILGTHVPVVQSATELIELVRAPISTLAADRSAARFEFAALGSRWLRAGVVVAVVVVGGGSRCVSKAAGSECSGGRRTA